MIGIPGTPGFVTKFILVSSLISNGNFVLAFSILLLSILSVAYCWRIIEVIYFENSEVKNTKITMNNYPSLANIYILLFLFGVAMIYLSFDTTLTIGYANLAVEQLLYK